ncbi:hypothetical protein IWX90DRAFT_483754 [Phyllosticta citrichinensis]|uniref:Uncharacterized protein n=1 Tax=Phyllosticta citrichinensis TaxID=1130410 RepID=A0ABR1Y442_9PEZI
MKAAQGTLAETTVERHLPVPDFAKIGTRQAPDEIDEFWRRVPGWEDVSADDFKSYRWSNLVEGKQKLHRFLERVLPENIPTAGVISSGTEPREGLIEDVFNRISDATMSVRVILKAVHFQPNRSNPRNDPIFRQFIPTRSIMKPDHPNLTLDSLEEKADSSVPGLVHRYPEMALFLQLHRLTMFLKLSPSARRIAYSALDPTQMAPMPTAWKKSLEPGRSRWEAVFKYVQRTPEI